MPIRILDAATVGRIAAGEVVERPSSVVKELVENSLDAGATAITVEIRGGGIDYLRVTDNGCGIEPGQVRLAFENHATSKLQNADQLSDIRTLGFRGEALPSIASVSHVEMTTRAKQQDSGVRLNVDGGENLRVRDIGCPEGTTFVMKDLFYNIPVRRAFLKKPSYEGGLVSDAVARLMIGNPGVSMRFINNGNTVYHSFGDGKLRHAVFAVYGKTTAEKMVELDAAEGGTRVFGMIGVGELAKSTRAHQMFFINGRSVRCALLSRTLEQVCRSRVTIGMYPMCALNLVLPPNAIDVNVHPNKLEVRFRDETATQVMVEKLLATAFEGEKVLQFERDTAPVRSIERVATVREITPEELKRTLQSQETSRQPDTAASAGMPREEAEQSAREKRFREALDREKMKYPDAPSNSTGSATARFRESVSEKMPPLPGRLAEQQPETGTAPVRFRESVSEKTPPLPGRPAEQQPGTGTAPDRTAEPLKRPAPEPKELGPVQMPELVNRNRDIPQYRIIGVAFKTYILIEAEETLLLIDQHAAHERLRYEMYCRQLEQGMASQQLLTPIVLHLSAREMALIRENLEMLSEAGYAVEPFGDSDIRVTAVPYVLGKAELRPLFMDMINSLNRLKAATLDARRAEIMQMACKSAVKGGDALSDSEIEALIREMLSTDAPPTCPHGRPIVKAVSRRDLEKMFKRIQ